MACYFYFEWTINKSVGYLDNFITQNIIMVKCYCVVGPTIHVFDTMFDLNDFCIRTNCKVLRLLKDLLKVIDFFHSFTITD